MNRLDRLFQAKNKRILNIYFTAGYPRLDDTVKIITELANSGADLIELGMPYSDPLADGLTIQKSSAVALKNGMQLDLLFEQIKTVRSTCDVPIMLMGYYNQLIQYGKEKFLTACQNSGIDGLIIPDLPMDYYELNVKSDINNKDLRMTFLITPETEDDRIRQADKLSNAFLYVVAKSSITGNTSQISKEQKQYFARLDGMGLQSNRLVGFGIHDKASFDAASDFGNGAIIGSAFIRMLEKDGIEGIAPFVKAIID